MQTTPSSLLIFCRIDNNNILDSLQAERCVCEMSHRVGNLTFALQLHVLASHDLALAREELVLGSRWSFRATNVLRCFAVLHRSDFDYLANQPKSQRWLDTLVSLGTNAKGFSRQIPSKQMSFKSMNYSLIASCQVK